MKINKITVNDFQQFENLELDFTYKSGPKKGKPLDKVCFIGQSGTGKTTLLELIAEYCYRKESGLIEWLGIPEKAIFEVEVEDLIKEQNKLLLYVKDEILSNMTVFTSKKYPANLGGKKPKNPGDFAWFDKNTGLKTSQEAEKEQQRITEIRDKIDQEKIITISNETTIHIWEYLLDDIKKYDNEIRRKGAELIERGLFTDTDKMREEIEAWRKKNTNPRIDLAKKCLNPLLAKFNLEVNTEVSNAFIEIRQKNIKSNQSIPINGISTGTKQVILSAIPLFKLDTTGTIICFDEPERSLFPDIQLGLIEYYQSLAPDAQFFIATHSPIIAASFEPEERFILYFDDAGKVKVKNGVSPIGDDPNDILKNDFDMVHLMNQYGVNAYKKYLELKAEIHGENDKEKKKVLLQEMITLGDKYDF